MCSRLVRVIRLRCAVVMSETHEPTTTEVAAFIERMVAELATLARVNRLEMLAYLLDIAREEAAARAADARVAVRR